MFFPPSEPCAFGFLCLEYNSVIILPILLSFILITDIHSSDLIWEQGKPFLMPQNKSCSLVEFFFCLFCFVLPFFIALNMGVIYLHTYLIIFFFSHKILRFRKVRTMLYFVCHFILCVLLSLWHRENTSQNYVE